jgi:threonyl-tRNA synthetase
MSTIQFDFNLPDRFDLSYIGEDGEKHRPYMVHRALFGSIERFFGILVEHYSGAFPVWLAPEQVRVLPLSEDQLDAAAAMAAELRRQDIRAAVDRKSGKIGAKIRNAQMDKVPYMLVLGAKEIEGGTVAVRDRSGAQTVMTLIDFVEKLKTAVQDKT